MNLEHASKLAQKCIQGNPVLVLGSGSSIPHGLGSMGGLATYLRENITLEEGTETDAWVLIRTALVNEDGLEQALLKNEAPHTLVMKIVRLTWQFITEADLELLSRASIGAENFPLSDLFNALMQSTHRTVNVVTTNYDRVCEYAVDTAGLIHSTGFSPGIIQRREGTDSIHICRGRSQARTVRIWKVHGSLDWFADQNGNISSLPLSHDIAEELTPLIVTPGVSKFQRTYDEPFRSAIQGADVTLGQATAFICIGYGFRDTHIQPKLMERSKQANVPVVVLAKELTDETKAFLRDNAGRNYIAFEEHAEGTMTYTADYPDGYVIPERDLWSLNSFNKIAF